MYSVRCRFYPKVEGDKYEELVWNFISALFQNGQVLGEDLYLTSADEALICSTVCPEMESVTSVHCSVYGTHGYQKLAEASRSDPTWEVLGETVDSNKPCSCENPGSYVLFTSWECTEPPVVCNHCGGYVPLYRLPYLDRKPFSGDDDSHYRTISWARAYRATDRLYMLGVGERFALRQMRNPKSQLSEEGRDICRSFSEKTGRPFYYFLFSSSERPTRKCPSCKQEWEKTDSLARGLNVVCRRCGLVAYS